MRPAQRVGPRLGEAEVADVAGLDHLLDGPDRLLDRHGRVDPGRLVEVDIVGAEPAQRVGEEVLHRHGAAVDADEAAVGRAHCAELDGDEYVLAPAPLERLAEQQLVVARAVEVAGVEERDARVQCGMDRREALGAVGWAVEVGHAHAAKADRRQGRTIAPQSARLHVALPSLIARRRWITR